MQNAVFIADSGPAAGLGHLRRCLVLAEAFARHGFSVSGLVTSQTCEALVRDYCFAVQNWTGGSLPELPHTDVVIIDGYRFDKDLSAQVKRKWGCKIVISMDDLAESPVSTDIILNHNIYGAALDYSGYRVSRILAGPRYALVSQEFLALRNMDRPSPPRVIISFGSLDDGRFALPVVERLISSNAQVSLSAVVPALASPYEEVFAKMCGDTPLVELHRHIDMARLMREASLYVGAAGVTLMEALAAGLGIVACATAQNQRYNIDALKMFGCAASSTFDPDEMVRAAGAWLESGGANTAIDMDGLGPDRVVSEALKLIASAKSTPAYGA